MNPTIKGDYQPSYWELQSFFNNIDIAILGSGIVGLSAAIYMKEQQPSLHVVILERGILPTGASTRNAGFACFGSLSELMDDLQNNQESEVLDLVSRRWEGLMRLRERVGDVALRYKGFGNYEIFRPEEVERFENCKEQISYFNEKLQSIINHKEVFKIADHKIGHFGFSGVQHLIHNQAEGQIHTGQMMKALLEIATQKGVRIFNGVAIKKFQETETGVELVTTKDQVLQCGKLLVATNGFSKQLLPTIELQPARNQVLITKPIPNLKCKACFHYDRGYVYFRGIDNRILLGGGRNLALEQETTDEFGTTENIKTALLNLLQEVILPGQQVEVAHWWSGIMGVGAVKKPIAKKIGKHIVIAIRMGGMGVAIGSLVGEEGGSLLL